MFERLRAELQLDTSGFRSGVQDAQNDLDSLGNRAQSMGKSMAQVGTGLTATVTGPLALVAKRSLSAAADAEELGDRAEAVFGDMTEEVEQWADQTAEEMGRSRNTLLDHTATMQDMLDPTGEATEEVADLSMGMAELAEDVGSFQNMESDQVMEKFMSAMAGQSRAVRDLGVDMSAAAVEAELLEMGVEGGAEAATDAQEAQARYNILMRETQAAHGDAQRTADTFTGAMRRVRSRASDLAAEMGQHLLPVATALAGHIDGLIDMFDGLSEKQQRMIVVVGALLAAIGPVLVALGSMAIVIGSLSAPVIAAVAAIAALAGMVAMFYDDLDPVIDAVEDFVDAAVPAFEDARDSAMDFWDDLQPALNEFRDLAERIAEVVVPILIDLGERFIEFSQTAIDELEPVMTTLRNELIPTLEFLAQKAGELLDWIGEKWDSHGEKVLAVVNPIIDILKVTLINAIDFTVATVSALLAVMRGDFDSAREIIVSAISRMVTRAVELVTGWDLDEKVKDVIDSAVESVKDFKDDVETAIEDAIDGALEKVKEMTDRFKEAGKGLIGAVADGIKESAGEVADAVKEAGEEAAEYLPSSDAEKGPLSTLTDQGAALPETFASGIENKVGAVGPAASEVAARAKPRVGAEGAGGRGGAGGGAGGGSDRVVNELQALRNELKTLRLRVDMDLNSREFNRIIDNRAEAVVEDTIT